MGMQHRRNSAPRMWNENTEENEGVWGVYMLSIKIKTLKRRNFLLLLKRRRMLLEFIYILTVTSLPLAPSLTSATQA